jgi:hypothetical protein
MTKTLSIGLSCAISAPTVAMCIMWVAVVISPTLGFSESWKWFLVVLWLLGTGSSIAGILYFLVARFALAQKTWDVVICLAVSIVGICMSICGFFYSIGAASSVG